MSYKSQLLKEPMSSNAPPANKVVARTRGHNSHWSDAIIHIAFLIVKFKYNDETQFHAWNTQKVILRQAP
jgi:hypothetical protein